MEIGGVTLSDAEIALGEDRVHRTIQQQDGGEAEIRLAAIEALRDDLALFSVARELGIADIQRPADIIERLDAVNRERAAAVDAGEVVYGPVAYDLRTFYGKALSQLRTSAVTALGDEELVTEEDVRDRFDMDEAEWAASATTYRLIGIRLSAVEDPDAGMTPEAFAEALSSTAPASIVDVAVTARDLESGSWSPEYAELIRAAGPGSVIGPMPVEGAWIVYRLEATDVDRESALDTYRTRIRQQLLEEVLDQRTAEEREKQVVTGH